MWTAWTTSLVFAIAVGGLFCKGPSWDQYTVGVVILALVVLAALLRDQIGTALLRQMEPAEPQTAAPRHEEDEAPRRRITALQARVGEFRDGHSWCIRVP
jgi:cell division protein FtsW (lipid II flippase)